MACHQAVVDLHGTVVALGFSVGAAELHVPIDLRSGHGNLLARSSGAAILLPYKCACRTFGGNITTVTQQLRLQFGIGCIM